ncbi:hypothetical protein ETD86_10885 [Nonomuraea turkmeniaca]|uniref:DGQHR domain-containing protein n=1 Tax=Nonomuraea turkmeniaca TaxID=103838 RepID=A0A5S4G9G1_9ACTN|nr:hypothetical protein [Nonomuraea turkmeniaca]TMR22630.1 hypothetical protein ETD86_10885 [Nonomuraea turkmeniaca]
MPVFQYPAFRTFQTSEGKPLILFAARATDIEQWAGIPRRARLHGDGETVGFQREVKMARVKDLGAFFGDSRNIAQNPLMAALQSEDVVRFDPIDGSGHFGHITIDTGNLAQLPLIDLLRRFAALLEDRVPALSASTVSRQRIQEAIAEAQRRHGFSDGTENDSDEESLLEGELDLDAGPDEDIAGILMSEETNILEFYTELIVRISALERLSPDRDREEILGFRKEDVLAYLLPIVLVDGQHRLRGAINSAEKMLESDAFQQEIMDAVVEGVDPDEAERQVIGRNARNLPISLLMDPSPSEHVFQFVVVNQKATPMAPALLGTIVSTSLGADELEPVAQRLRDAGIKLDDSQAIAYLTRAPESPFKDYVQRGMTGDRPDQLQWTVLQGLVRIFRELKGGKRYGDKNDYAAMWREDCLSDSALVREADDPYAVWSEPDGPWRDIFIRFYTQVRDYFGSDDSEAENAWGTTRSNLFNKVSLTILAADFFDFLQDRRITLDSTEQLNEAFSEWLGNAKPSYFDRKWDTTGLKKDTDAVRKKWAKLWSEYRRNPRGGLPRVTEYRP